METLIDALHVYAQENLVGKRLQSREYRQAAAGIEESWNAFKATLTAEQGAKLAALMSREIKIDRLEDKAALLAGISIGLELGRL